MDIYLDEATGKYYIWNGSSFVPYNSQNNSGGGSPQIGDKPDDLADEEEHEAELEKERAEDEASGMPQDSGESEESRIEKVKKALDSDEVKQGIEKDNIRISQRERQRQREKAKQAAQTAGGKSSSAGIRAFEKDLKDFMNNEVKETEMSTWSRQNRRYVDSPFIMPGTRYEENRNMPSIGVYFDQSGSWSEADVEKGKNAIACLYDLQKKGKIKFELKYFANSIHTDAAAARSEGGTGAGEELIRDIQNMKYDNVVVMTDSDFDHWGEINNAPNIKVKGAVWLLWKGGAKSERLKAHLQGKKRNREYDV